MKIYELSSPPSAALARALAEFEKPFTYPLGEGRFFRISHGDDYTLFFRAQGEGSCFIAEHEERIVGVLGTAIRRLLMPSGEECTAVYLGDLKIAPAARGGTILARLARAAERTLRPLVRGAFGVVMDGTLPTPDRYTGRAGIPEFHNLGHLTVLRILHNGKRTRPANRNFHATHEAGEACYRRLSLGRYVCPAPGAEKRSDMAPRWLIEPQGSACGLLEDTRKAKRLITGDGSEMLSAHLSCFAYDSVSAAADLIRLALEQAALSGLPALFVAVSDGDAKQLWAELHGFEVVPAPATVYGAGLMPGAWNINTAEI